MLYKNFFNIFIYSLLISPYFFIAPFNKAVAADLALRPYIGVSYSYNDIKHTTHENSSFSYSRVRPSGYYMPGITLGVASRQFMYEISGSLSNSVNTGVDAYGIQNARTRLGLMRLSAIWVVNKTVPNLLERNFGSDRSLLIIAGLVHGFERVNYTQPEGASSLPNTLEKSAFGTSWEVGIGYMFELGPSIALRLEARYSPLELGNSTKKLISGIGSLQIFL